MNTKTALVILVLVTLAMLLVVVVALGVDHPSQPSGGVESALEKLRSDRFLRVEGDVTADCPVPPTVVVVDADQTCTITIPKSGFLSKPTRAVLAAADTSQLELAVDPDRGPMLSMTLKPGKCVEAVVGRGGGTITLSNCAAIAGACAVTLLQEGCRIG